MPPAAPGWRQGAALLGPGAGRCSGGSSTPRGRAPPGRRTTGCLPRRRSRRRGESSYASRERMGQRVDAVERERRPGEAGLESRAVETRAAEEAGVVDRVERAEARRDDSNDGEAGFLD